MYKDLLYYTQHYSRVEAKTVRRGYTATTSKRMPTRKKIKWRNLMSAQHGTIKVAHKLLCSCRWRHSCYRRTSTSDCPALHCISKISSQLQSPESETPSTKPIIIKEQKTIIWFIQSKPSRLIWMYNMHACGWRQRDLTCSDFHINELNLWKSVTPIFGDWANRFCFVYKSRNEMIWSLNGFPEFLFTS